MIPPGLNVGNVGSSFQALQAVIETAYLSLHPSRDATPRGPPISLGAVCDIDRIELQQVCGMGHLESANELERVRYICTKMQTWAAI